MNQIQSILASAFDEQSSPSIGGTVLRIAGESADLNAIVVSIPDFGDGLQPGERSTVTIEISLSNAGGIKIGTILKDEEGGVAYRVATCPADHNRGVIMITAVAEVENA